MFQMFSFKFRWPALGDRLKSCHLQLVTAGFRSAGFRSTGRLLVNPAEKSDSVVSMTKYDFKQFYIRMK